MVALAFNPTPPRGREASAPHPFRGGICPPAFAGGQIPDCGLRANHNFQDIAAGSGEFRNRFGDFMDADFFGNQRGGVKRFFLRNNPDNILEVGLIRIFLQQFERREHSDAIAG